MVLGCQVAVWTDALNYCDNAAGLPKSTLSRRRFGGSVGGPQARDRAFYFGSNEGYRHKAGLSFIEAIPSVANAGLEEAEEGGRYIHRIPTRCTSPRRDVRATTACRPMGMTHGREPPSRDGRTSRDAQPDALRVVRDPWRVRPATTNRAGWRHPTYEQQPGAQHGAAAFGFDARTKALMKRPSTASARPSVSRPALARNVLASSAL